MTKSSNFKMASSLKNAQAYRWYFKRCVQKGKIPLGAQAWPTDRYQKPRTGEQICLWEKPNGTLCGHLAENRGALTQHYIRRHLGKANVEIPAADQREDLTNEMTEAYYDVMRAEHQRARDEGEETPNDESDSSSDEGASPGKHVKKNPSIPEGHVLVPLLHRPIGKKGTINKTEMATVARAMGWEHPCTNQGCTQAKVCQLEGGCMRAPFFRHGEN